MDNGFDALDPSNTTLERMLTNYAPEPSLEHVSMDWYMEVQLIATI
jgi:hypothetical protein